jgi:chromosome segregation and condensation protein ScpB/DNA-binding XRE family transcriptional regulator
VPEGQAPADPGDAAATAPRRRGRRAAAPAATEIAQELRRRRGALKLTVRQAADRAEVSPSVISEIETGRRVPSLRTYARLGEGLGLDVPATVLLPERRPADRLDEHLTALAACVVVQHGGPLADLAAALGVSIAAVREGVLHIAPRLAAVGLSVVVDSVDVRVSPLPAATSALEALAGLDHIPQVSADQLEVICIAAHLGVATRADIEARRGEDCESVLRRMLDRGLVEKVPGAPSAVNRYRVTTAAISATGHATLESLQRFLAESITTPLLEVGGGGNGAVALDASPSA